MFDLTKETRLTPKMQRKYIFARTLLHVIFLLFAGFVGHRILFPIIPLDFSMNNPNSSKNTLVAPRIEQSGQFPEKRLVRANEKFIFNANPIGNFSAFSVEFVLDKNEKSIMGSNIDIRRSYAAFFYPSGKPIGFKNGMLLTTTDGEYFMVSNEKLRKFSSTEIILKLGYPKNAFLNVATDDLKYNDAGNEISDSNSYPDNTIFLIDENYYMLENQELQPFISAKAFLSQFNPANAIEKSINFLSQYPVKQEYLGFADGSLVSSPDSVFIISEGKSYPVENSETFLAMGFDFNKVIPISQDELNAHKKQKQFTHNDPHPNGTVFFDKEMNKYFIIKNNLKLPLASETIANTYMTGQKPVIADSKEMQLESSCKLKSELFSTNTYSCSTSIQNLESAIGNDYQISAKFSNDIKVKNIRTTFSTPLKWNNLKNSLSKIKQRIMER